MIDWQPTALGKGAVKWCSRCYNHHPSRNEIVLRSGFRGCGQSKTIRYGTATSEFDRAEAAIAAAALWVESRAQTGAAHALGSDVALQNNIILYTHHQNVFVASDLSL